MAPESININRRLHVRVGTLRQQPIENLLLVEVHCHMQQCRPIQLSPVKPRQTLSRERIDVLAGKAMIEEISVLFEMTFEQIDATTMESHHSRVVQMGAVPREHLQTSVLSG